MLSWSLLLLLTLLYLILCVLSFVVSPLIRKLIGPSLTERRTYVRVNDFYCVLCLSYDSEELKMYLNLPRQGVEPWPLDVESRASVHRPHISLMVRPTEPMFLPVRILPSIFYQNCSLWCSETADGRSNLC